VSHSDNYIKTITLNSAVLNSASFAPIIVEAMNLAMQGQVAAWKMEFVGNQIKVAFTDEQHLVNFERVFSGVRLGLAVANNAACVPCSIPMDAYQFDITTHGVSDKPSGVRFARPLPTKPRGVIRATNQD
jgi:hypothetical protein